MTRRPSRRVGARRKDPRADQAASPGRLRRLCQRRSFQAGLLFSLLLFTYLANGEILPGQDATVSVRLAGKLVTQRKLVFTPEEDPFMFVWSLKTPKGIKSASFRSWQSPYEGEPIRRSYERGELSQPTPIYHLIPTRFSGVYVNKYGPGAGIFAVPFVAAVYPFTPHLYDGPSAAVLWHATKVAAAAAVAGSAVFLFLAALAFVRPSTAAGLALAYGLGTCVWSSSSQALWQHGPAELFLALGTFLLLRPNRSRSAPWVGLAYALAFACRPTAALAIAAAGFYYLVSDRRALLGLASGCLPVAVLLSAYNVHYFGKLVMLGQLSDVADKSRAVTLGAGQAAGAMASTSLAFGTSLWVGLTGISVSPSRGLLIFSPAVVFLFWGLVRAWRDRTFAALRPVAVAALAMCFVAGRWCIWWGGWSYGYRLLVDAVTLLAFFAIPVAEEIRRRRILLVTCAACVAWGVLVQVVGAFAYDVTSWNDRAFIQVNLPGSAPRLFTDLTEARQHALAGPGSMEEVHLDVNSGQGQHRLWSIRDSQILYYLEHFLEARRSKRATAEQFLRSQG